MDFMVNWFVFLGLVLYLLRLKVTPLVYGIGIKLTQLAATNIINPPIPPASKLVKARGAL